MKRYLNSILFFVIVISIFLSYSITVYAVPKRLKDGTWIDVPWSEYGEEIGYLLQYAFSTMGVIFNGDLEQWIKNNETYKDLYDENGRLARHTTIDPETETVSYDKEIMVVLKELINDYAKQNEPYHMVETYPLNEIPMSNFTGYKNVYDTLVNLLNDSPSGVVLFGCYRGTMVFTDLGHWFTRVSPVKLDKPIADDLENITFYNNETWDQLVFRVWCNTLAVDDTPIKTMEEFSEKAGVNYVQSSNASLCNVHRVFKVGSIKDRSINATGASYGELYVISKDARRIRVFNTYADFQNFTVGKRNVYYTNEYYNYVPEDLTVSIDDLQKTVDDLQKVIDELLKQIGDNTSENEIEELLAKILEELQKNPGSGSGSGGGDVNVDIDLSTTNSWLAKIYAKVSQIFDKISETAGNASDAVHAKIQESLDEIVEQLKKLKRWTAVDTVIDGVDAIGDWLSLLRDIVKDAESGVGSAVSAVSSALGETVDLASRKFPFSIPWDILFFVSVMSSEPQVPQFEIPFDIELSALDIRIDYTMQLDFSQFQWLSDLSRLILSLTYAAGLLKMTFRVTPAGKEE